MKNILIFLLFFCLAACQGNGSGSDQAPGVDPKPEPKPAPGVVSLTWGELPCQKAGDCNNPVLNLNRDQLEYQLRLSFEDEVVKVYPEDEAAFYCGVVFSEYWEMNYPDIGIVDQEAYAEIGVFGRSILDLPFCQLKDDLSEQINQYFFNTEEYKDATN